MGNKSDAAFDVSAAETIMKPLLSIISVSLPLLGTWAQAVEPNATEIFKRLLSAPPIVRQMVYLDKVSPLPRSAEPLQAAASDSAGYTRYFLTWQPNAISFHTAPKVSTTDSRTYYDEFFLGWRNEFYFLNGRQFAFRYQHGPGELKPGPFPAAYHAALIKQHAAYEPINLGLNHLMPGSVVWEGENFSAVGSADQKPMFIWGRISVISNHVPTEMQVHYSNDMGIANYRISYQYSEYQPPYYPSRISTYFQHNRKETECDNRILSVAATNTPLPRAAFEPLSYLTSNHMSLRVLTNNSIYTQLPSGRLVETPGATPKMHLTPTDYYANRYYYLAVIIISTGFLYLAVRRSSQLQPLL